MTYGQSVYSQVTQDAFSTWTFIGKKDDNISISVIPTLDFDVLFDVLDVEGTSIFSEIDSFSEIDGYSEGEAEWISGWPLPSSGEFSIVVGGYEGSVGNYRLTLTEAIVTGSPEGENQVSERENFSNSQSLTYGQSVYSQVTQDVPSTSWTFNGEAGDSISISVIPGSNFDVLFDVRNETNKSIFNEDQPNYTSIIGYVYVLLIGVAVILGIRSLFRKPQNKENT